MIIRCFKICLGIIISCCVSRASASTAELVEHLHLPEVRAFLDTIAYAEGTLCDEGYRMHFGKSLFDEFKDHPRHVITARLAGKEIRSSAAGKYQFLRKTWDEVSRTTGMRSFSPVHQDCGAVYLLKNAGALDLIKKGDFSQALERVKDIWASLPGAPYGQPIKAKAELYTVFIERLSYYKRLSAALR